MASVIYNSFKKDIQNGSIDLDTNTVYVQLVTATYVADIDTHTKESDITNEVTGTGYTAGGLEITSLTVTQDNTDDEGVWDGADVTWATSTITARGAVIYKSTGASTTDNLIAYIDFGENKSSSGGDFKIQWSTEGVINLS